MTTIVLDGEKLDPAALPVLGQGGEAEVHDLGDGRALKLFKPPHHPDFAGDAARVAEVTRRLAELEAKLTAFPRGLPRAVVAPVALARDRKGRAVVGYAMPKVSGTPMYQLGEPRHRRGAATDLRALVASFRDLHASVSALHAAGVVLGDFNDGNVLVDGARCHLIDADSFQYGAWRCPLYTDRYVDPRLCDRGGPAPILERPHDRDSDWFAFTAMLFRALAWVGPFGGVHQPADPQARVAPGARPLRGPSVFGRDVIYPRSAAPLAGLPDDLAAYFRAVFDGGTRGPFPAGLLERLALARCPHCAIDHGRASCPTCRHAAPAVAITRAITAIAIDPRTVTRATVAVGTSTSAPVWLQGSALVRRGVLGPEPFGQIVPGATRAWIGAQLGAGWWRAGGYAVAFTFAPGRGRLDDRARLPALRGRVVDCGCALADDRAWLWWRLADRAQERVLLCCVAGGQVRATAEAPADDADWLAGLAGACAAGPYLFVPTDDGIVRVEEVGGDARVTRRFTETAPLTAAADDLHAASDGLVIVKAGAPLVLATGAARAVRLSFTARAAGQET